MINKKAITLLIGATLIGLLSSGCSNTSKKQPPKADLPSTNQETLSPLAQEYIERFGILNTASIAGLTDQSMQRDIASLAQTVKQRYRQNNRADVNVILISDIRYAERPHHYTLRPIELDIARGDSFVIDAKSNNFKNDGVHTLMRVTLSDNNRLYINGTHVDQIYKEGTFWARAERNNTSISATITVIE